MATIAKIKSIFVLREDHQYDVNVDVKTDLAEPIELHLTVHADNLQSVPSQVQKKLCEFATQLAEATDSVRKME